MGENRSEGTCGDDEASSQPPVRNSKKASVKRPAHSVETGVMESKRKKTSTVSAIQSSTVQRKLFQSKHAAIAQVKAIYDASGINLMPGLVMVDLWRYLAKLSKSVEKIKHLISEEKNEIEVKRKEFLVAEMKLCLMKVDWVKEEAKLFLNALK